METKQHRALQTLQEQWGCFKEKNNIKWYNLIFPTGETKKALDARNFRQYHIINHPEYIGENGEALNEVEVDYRNGCDMEKYGWASREEYKKEVSKT